MDVFDLVAKISLDSSGYEKGLKDAESSGSSFASKLGGGLKTASKIGVGAIAAVTGATAALTGALVGGAKNVANYGDEVDKTSQKLGLSTDAYQKWNYVLNLSGTEMSSMTTGLKTLTNKLDDAKNGSSDAQAMFQKLGLSMEDVNNMSREEVFEATIKGFQGMADSTERAALANDLFGRSGQNLTPLFNQTAEQTEEQLKLAEKYGMVMPEAAVKASAAFNDSLTTMQMTMTGLKNRMMGEFLPSITTVMDGLAKVFAGEDGLPEITEGISEFAKKLTESVPKILDVGGGIVIALGKAIIDNLPTLVDAAVKAIMTFIKGIVDKLPDILNAGIEILITLIDGITEALPQLIPAMIQAIEQMVIALIENAPLLIQSALELILALAQGLIDSIPSLIDALPTIIEALVTGLVQNAPMLAIAAVKLQIALAGGLINAIPELIKAIPKIILAIVNGIKEGAKDMMSAGGDLVRGIWDGFVGKVDWIKEKIKGWVGNVTDFIKGLFKIGSPSKLFRDEIGQWLPEGIAVGIEANADSVYDQMDEMRKKVSTPFDVSVIGNTDIKNPSDSQRNKGYNSIISAIDSLADKMEGMNVILSTGETVGALTPHFDRSLGAVHDARARSVV